MSSPSPNFRITTSMMKEDNFFTNLSSYIENHPTTTSFTYVDQNILYMNGGTPCQQPLSNELDNISLNNMPNFNTASTEQKATYILTEIGSWKPRIIVIEGNHIHAKTHVDFVKTLTLFTPKPAHTVTRTRTPTTST
jgi:hypothetical protein